MRRSIISALKGVGGGASPRAVVKYIDWAPQYDRIRAAFDFPFAREEAAAARLEELLTDRGSFDPIGRIRSHIKGREAIIVGLAPGAGPPPLWRLSAAPRDRALVCADGATQPCLSAGFVPTLIVTDLD